MTLGFSNRFEESAPSRVPNPALRGSAASRRWRRAAACLGLGLAALGLGGCGKGSAPVAPDGRLNIKRVAILYGQFVGSARGRAPKDEAEFRQFIKAQQTGGAGEQVDVLTSPRDGKPYGIPYGAAASKTLASGLAAYEQEGINGMRQVAFTIGMIEEVDESRLQELLAGR